MKNEKYKIIVGGVLVTFVAMLAMFGTQFLMKDKSATEEVSTEEIAYGKLGEIIDSIAMTEDTSIDVVEAEESPITLEQSVSTNEDGENIFKNLQDQYTFVVPDGLSVYENNNIVYLRNNDAGTQIAFYIINDSFTSSSNVAENAATYAYKMTGYFYDKEISVSNFAPKTLSSYTVGDFDLIQDRPTFLFRNPFEDDRQEIQGVAYYGVFDQGENAIETYYNGLIMYGTSTTEDEETLATYMDSILTSMQPYEVTEEEKDVYANYVTYTSEKADSISFNYPDSFIATTNDDGMVTIRAKQSATSYYSGMYIQYFCDEDNTYAKEDYVQLATDYEAQILLQTFGSDYEVYDNSYTINDFTFDHSVVSMQADQTLNGMPCYEFEIEDYIYASGTGRYDLGVNGPKIYCYRYCFESNGKACMMNIIYPESAKEDCMALAGQIISSIKQN